MAKSGLWFWNLFSWTLNMILIPIWYPMAFILAIFGAWGLGYDPAFDLISQLKYPEMINFGLTDIQIVIGLGSVGGNMTPKQIE